MTIIHTAEIRLSYPDRERICIASLKKRDILDAAHEWRIKYPGIHVNFGVILDNTHVTGE